MFQSEELDNHLKTSHTVQIESAVYVEWNLNDSENVKKIGNYRYRPTYSSSPYYLLPANYDDQDLGNYYTNATDSDTVIESGFDDNNQPTLFTTTKEKMKLLYSLDDCIKPYRPRSGINKLLYLGTPGAAPGQNQYIDNANAESARRPRYYMGSRYDQFKYWTSYRTEYGTPTPRIGQAETESPRQVERGVSFTEANGLHYIEDTVPFVVYNNSVPTNKIIIKMQTNVGEVDLGTIRYNDQEIPDPLYGYANATTPIKWRIEALKNNTWTTIYSFDENSLDENDNPIIGADGYVEISYGLVIPDQYKTYFKFAEEISSATLLPEIAPTGYTYLVKETEHELGTMYIYDGDAWASFVPQYRWDISNQVINYDSKFVTQLNDPDYYFDINNQPVYREFEFIDGMRIVVQTMNKVNCTFDLIEFSPRLVADISKAISDFSITKTMSDLGNGSIPVGMLAASIGSINIFDIDSSFNENNTFNFETRQGSIIANYLSIPAKFLFYDITRNVNNYDYFIPIKTMYNSLGFPQIIEPGGVVSINLRDFFFFLESHPAPQLLMTEVSLSYAVMLLLDYIGFDNIVFKRIEDIPEIIIPYFFVAPDQNCAEVLQQLAVASQSAMFFDEYNNLVIMSKEYLLPENETIRATDSALYGQTTDGKLPNIINLASQDKRIYNSGTINYTTRYIQRSIGTTDAALRLDQYNNFVYKPALLWEVQGRESTKTQNELGAQNQGYTLSAIPLNTDLDDQIPYIQNNIIYNNIIDIGENVFWLASYQGYFYANGEIIKFDAVEYAVSVTNGTQSIVWITNNQEYQYYFGKLPFNGKMYPTGNIRIYTKPEYETIDGELVMRDTSNEQPMKEHGRGQFGTPVVYHPAGLAGDSYWTNNDYVVGCIQNAKDYLFNTSDFIDYPTLSASVAGKVKNDYPSTGNYFDSDVIAKQSTRNGIIKNFLAQTSKTEQDVSYLKTTDPGTVQSSALVFNGPALPTGSKPEDFVSYIYKTVYDQDGQPIPYKHFGTRMRIIGKVESGTNKSQTPTGGYEIYQASNSTDQNVKVYGGSGGLGIGINKDTNNGYFFEIVALTVDNIDQYGSDNDNTVVSYKIYGPPSASASINCVNNEVTVYTQNQITWQVGQSIIVTGLVDNNDPTNTRTPLNGEYAITAINNDKKSFKYKINASPALTTVTKTAGIAQINTATNSNFANVYFYKLMSDASANAIPYKLWSGLAQINVDAGNFAGQGKAIAEQGTSVYDLAGEWINVGTTRRFFLYLNNKQIATVDDPDPLPEYNNFALFIRGSSRCMFENVYALANNYSQNTKFTAQTGVANIFGDDEIDAREALRKYAISGLIQKTYLSGINSYEEPQYLMYFEEFGTIMRECAYFNIKYDRAFPALYAKIQKTLDGIKGYSVSGFYANSYGADFLIFNCTDFNLNLDDTSGNYLRIHGITFTQSTTYSLTIDDYLKKKSNIIITNIGTSNILTDPAIVLKQYNSIKNSRDRFGINEFTLESPYIQSQDVAEEVFDWTINKIAVPKKMVGVNTFGTSNLQLGDIITIDYNNNEGVPMISSDEKRFVIYNIEYQRNASGLNTTMYLAEV